MIIHYSPGQTDPDYLLEIINFTPGSQPWFDHMTGDADPGSGPEFEISRVWKDDSEGQVKLSPSDATLIVDHVFDNSREFERVLESIYEELTL